MKNLVLIGGGHSHAIALHLLGISPLPGVKLTLISNTTHTPYSGMLPGHLGGLYSFDECHINLAALAQFAQADLILDSAIGLDLERQQVLCHQHPPISFDWLSLDIGSTPAVASTPGAQEYTMTVKPVPQFLAEWNEFLHLWQQSLSLGRNRPLSLGIVGGGAAGVELALTLQVRLTQLLHQASGISPPGLHVHLFHRQKDVMTGYAAGVGKRFRRVLNERGIDLHLNETVASIEPVRQANFLGTETPVEELKVVRCTSGLSVLCDRVIWVTHAASPQWIQVSGLATDAQGFILVNQTLQSISHPNVFATGDIATLLNYPRPKAGVFAVRQGKPLFKNLRQITSGQPLQPFYPQKRHLALIGLGDRQAIAAWGRICIGPSSLLWRWKDWIDRRFMMQFQTVSEHSAPMIHSSTL
jgi:selenide, water dikinase